MENKIQFNAAIYPKVMSIIIGKPYNKNENDSDEMVLELVVDLPRSAYLIYLQKIFDEHVEPEIDLFKKYAYGVVLDDSDYMTLLSFIMTTTQRNWNKSINSGDLLAPFGLCMKVDDAGKRNLELLEETKDSIRVEAWEGIIIDLLSKSSMDIISCFDFDEHFERQAENSINDKLYISLGAWKYTPDTAEQNLSNALRAAFMFTLVGYYSGDRKNQYSSFVDYFEAEFYKRVSLVYGMWVSLEDKTKIKYLPLYDSFYNLTSSSKNELISVLKAVLDNDSIALDEKQTLKAQLIESAGQFHTNISSADVSLEQTLIKPVINLVLLREKAKETLQSAELLYSEDKYMLDYALRRRFAFFDIKPGFETPGFREYRMALDNEKFNKLVSCVESLNREISVDESLGEGFCIGHSYFCNLQPDTIDDSWLYGVVEYELISLLKEYWFDEPMKVKDWSENLRSTIK